MSSKDASKIKKKYISKWTKLFSEQMNSRLQKRKRLETEVKTLSYKNGYKPNVKFAELTSKYSELEKDAIGDTPVYEICGRVILQRDFGKAAFLQVDDGESRFQVYVTRDKLGDHWPEYRCTDYGDIIYAKGKVFKTNKGELSIDSEDYKILTKSIRPLPEKFHGMTDPELRYRMRYVDLIMNPESRSKLKKRSEIVRYIREFFYKREYLEVETPMMHSVAGGATAKPFNTHHNALDMELFMRIAPELHLKRLIVGGYPRVFEMNRCFRNEGLSLKHNPEFTTIEFYQAYATYEDLMDLTEDLLHGLAKDVIKSDYVMFGEHKINLANKFERMTIREAGAKYSGLSLEQIEDKAQVVEALAKKGISRENLKDTSIRKLQVLLFEEYAEAELIQPTFITEYPTEVSPLSRRSDSDPEFVDRFEFFMNGWEIANAFSELNNPTDQLDRFADQAVLKDMGLDEEACEVDYDFVRALEYGMPPTAGQGIGIDRLVMVLTDSPTIREVMLFPLLKKEHFFDEGSTKVENTGEEAK